MTKERLKALMKKHFIFKSEIDDICDFCSEVLEERAKELEETEPYATKTIKRYKDAAYEVYDLINYIEEIMEREE